MGKKAKIGKQRKDKFYALAKEAGYRSRAAFKLLQINRVYRFLENAKVCVDLCAAPGGWLQVAVKNMPVSSLIIGIDLYPISPIAKVRTFQEDITSNACRSLLKRELKNSAVDVFLHDGAPNIGLNWYHDAYKQNVLTLRALALAAEFLRENGTFVTKLFRSKDYFSLMWVLQQLFKKVNATKPQASRIESAEMFLICQGFLAPGKIDPKFFDPKFVFSEIDDCDSTNKPLNLLKGKKEVRNREGYPDGDLSLYHEVKASEFIESDRYFDLLNNASVIVLDEESIRNHPQTSAEIIECLKDIKILGKKELKSLINWRKKIRASMQKKNEATANTESLSTANEQQLEDMEMDEAIYEAEQTQLKLAKSKKKKLLKQKRKLRDKLALKMINPGDEFDLQNNELFDLRNIKTKKELRHIQNADMNENLVSEDEQSDKDVSESSKRTKVISLPRDRPENPAEDPFLQPFLSDDENTDDSVSDNQSNIENETVDEDVSGEENPLLVDLVHGSASNRKKSEAQLWYQNKAFQAIEDEINDDIDDTIIDYLKDPHNDNSVVEEEVKPEVLSKQNCISEDSLEKHEVNNEVQEPKTCKKKVTFAGDEKDEGEQTRLDPESLAIGHVMAQSKKAREQLIDESYNRFTGFGDIEGLPSWFVKDEEKHCRLPLSVPQEIVDEYKIKMRKINARPIKKILEAKARKKHRAMRQLKRISERIEAVPENLDPKEKGNQIKELYKNLRKRKRKQPITYVVSKKGKGGKLPARVKGRYKLVDRRMKKDKRRDIKKKKNR